MRRIGLLVGLLPMVGWGAAPDATMQDLLAACRDDMAHRSGLWQDHPDWACDCMFADNNWVGTTKPQPLKNEMLARLIRAHGGLPADLPDQAKAAGMEPNDLKNLMVFAQVYPAVMFQNKKVVGCFDRRCVESGSCDVRMNDVSGTLPR